MRRCRSRAPRARAAALALAAALAAGCARGTTTAGEAEPAPQPIAVAVAPVATVRVERTVPLVGAFHANEEVTVAAQIEARVAWLGPDMGDRVRAGDVILRLDDADLQAELREVEARLAKARADHARARVLREQGIMAHEEAERLRTEAAVLEARRDVLGVRIDRTVIRAPLGGTVAERSVAIGEIVQVGKPLYRIVESDPLRLRTLVPERFAGMLRLGEEVRAGVDAYPERTFTGRITRINPTSEPANRSILIEALVPNPEGLLKPGFFAKGDLVYDERGEALAVPERALTTFAGVTKLFVVRDGRAEERIVRTGVVVPGGGREIADGVAAGERVAVSQVDALEQGAPVEITAEVAALGADAPAAP